MEPFPNLASLSDADLKTEIDKLVEEEQEVSYKPAAPARTNRHAERRASSRGPGREASRVLDHVDVDKLAEILAGKASPPSEEPA